EDFFFSSRRRHTRFSRDWSSDVCSSDLHGVKPIVSLLRKLTGKSVNSSVRPQSLKRLIKFIHSNNTLTDIRDEPTHKIHMRPKVLKLLKEGAEKLLFLIC